MDKQIIALFIPILALAIPVSSIIVYGLQKLARIHLEEARLKAGTLDKESEADLASLRDEVGELRREVGEVQERLDFTERLLSQSRDMERLPDRRPGG